MDEFTKARLERGQGCHVCGDINCPGARSLIACTRLWGNPDVARIEYSPNGIETIGITFDRDMVELILEDE